MERTSAAPEKGKIGFFVLAMLNVAIICTLRGLPVMAKEGFALIFYYAAAAVLFLIPVSLVTAELATGWPPEGPGGVYVWVNEAFGRRLGFLAIWLQWIQNVIWYPTALSFLAATLAYIYDPALAGNKLYLIVVILAAYWGGTFANFRGMKTSGAISAVGVICGIFIPGMFIIVLGALWFMQGNVSEVVFSARKLIPDVTNIDNIVLFAGALLIFSGIEVSGVHSQEVRDPGRDYPRAIFISAAIAIAVLTMGSLAIAVVVPQKDISLVAGLMEAFRLLLDKFGLRWLIPLIAILITMGSIGELSSWIIGPSKGLLSTARHGHIPPFLRKVNAEKVPVNILLAQAVIVTLLAFVFLLMPTVSGSYWILSALCVILYLVMYLFLYAAVIRLRYSKPGVPRAYKIPGGFAGIWIVAGTGFLGALATLVISFFPPSQLKTGNKFFYESFLIAGTLLMCSIPFVLGFFRRPSWAAEKGT
ncbi:MAG: amino acid permease [Candidatus Omnitrophota bacterium]